MILSEGHMKGGLNERNLKIYIGKLVNYGVSDFNQPGVASFFSFSVAICSGAATKTAASATPLNGDSHNSLKTVT